MRISSVLAVSSLILATVLAGCHVSSHKNGDNDNVDIGTPFGSMQVKTNDNVNTSGLGLTPYPGAQVVKKEQGHDDGAADVNMSFGNFHLGVKAISFVTPDGADKVLAFYRKDLGKYGAVLQCDGKRAVGEPTRTAEGLTCASDQEGKGAHLKWGDDKGDHDIELRAGSKAHQHIVAVGKKDGQTKIGLVALDLPTNFNTKDDKDSD